MNESNSQQKSFIRKAFLLAIAALFISFIGNFTLPDNWMRIITNHLGGLGVTVLFACLSAFIANKKGYNTNKAFYYALLIPIILGLIATIIFSFITGFIYCGGGVVLLASVIIIIITLFLKGKNN